MVQTHTEKRERMGVRGGGDHIAQFVVCFGITGKYYDISKGRGR
jgi:hypothetical protein